MSSNLILAAVKARIKTNFLPASQNVQTYPIKFLNGTYPVEVDVLYGGRTVEKLLSYQKKYTHKVRVILHMSMLNYDVILGTTGKKGLQELMEELIAIVEYTGYTANTEQADVYTVEATGASDLKGGQLAASEEFTLTIIERF